MKKYKVMLLEISPKREDGHRDTLRSEEIGSFRSRGNAELTCKLLRDYYHKHQSELNWFGVNEQDDRCLYHIIVER